MTQEGPYSATLLAPGAWAGVRQQLSRCLELASSASLPATLMLVGSRGLGREALALELAAGLVCRRQPRAACPCSSCDRVRRGAHPDVSLIAIREGSTAISIEQTREDLVGTLLQRPFEGARRVFVVDSCQTPPLGLGAASALLKALEEPPGHVAFLLLAANPARVLPTILSRSVELRVAPPSPGELEALVSSSLHVATEQVGPLLEACGHDAALLLDAGDEVAAALAEPTSATSAAQGELSGLLGLDPPARPGPERAGHVVAALLAAVERAADAGGAGDCLAVLRLASAVKRFPVCASLAVATFLNLARRAGGEAVEPRLEAAATVLATLRRQEALNLDLEACLAGALLQVTRSG